MKKSFLFVAALALTFAACNNNEPLPELSVATFEELQIAQESVIHLSETGTFESGDFSFEQEVQDWGDWGVYYFGNVPTNKTSNEYKGDNQNDMSASGGAHSGANFVVWYASYSNLDSVSLKEASIVPGFYVNNTPWVVDAILNGDGMSDDGGAPFGATDSLTLTITGTLKGVALNHEVKVDLARGTSYIKEWTFVNLRPLGKVDALHFALTSSKKNNQGMTTPAYFAFDDLGAKQ